MKILFFLVALLVATTTYASTDRYLNGQYIKNNTYTLTIPAITDTLVTITGSATLTGKTMSGSDNTFSAIPVGAIGNGSVLSGSNTGDISLGTSANGLSLLNQVLSLGTSSSTTTGALSSTDWSLFNGKQDALGFTAVPDSRTVNGHALTADVTVTASDVSLGNVTNDAQVKKSEYTAKGDILVGTGAGTYSALAGSGTNDYVLTYDSATSTGTKWAAIPTVSPTITGSRGTPSAITAAGGIAFTGTNYSNIWFVQGDGGAIDVTANPQIAAGTNAGQVLTIIGRSDTNTVKLEDATGLSLNGAIILGADSSISLMWDGTNWLETSRR